MRDSSERITDSGHHWLIALEGSGVRSPLSPRCATFTYWRTARLSPGGWLVRLPSQTAALARPASIPVAALALRWRGAPESIPVAALA
jgi:hypothetical protein